MTVSNTTSRNQYTATSGQTVFPYTFEIFDKNDIAVLKNGTLLSEGTNYTVSGVGNDSGGNITLTVGATAGDILTFYRDMDYQRLTDYQNSGDFLAQEVNDDFDRLWLAIQQQSIESGRAIVKPITDSASIDMTLPSAADRANSYLIFDPTGAPSVVAAGDPSAPDAITRQDFTGDGSTVVYTLASAPGAAGAGVMIFIDGIQQDKDSYTITGTTLTFSEAPPLNSNINLVQLKATSIGEADSASVTYIPAGTGAKQTSVQSKLRETVSVKDFGAVGDGVTDDTAAIQAALDYISSGKKLFFPSGEYKLTDQVELLNSNNISICGTGASKLVKSSGFPSSTFLMNFTDCTNVNIFNMEFEGSTVAAIDFPSFGDYGLRLRSCVSARVESCNFYNFGDSALTVVSGWYAPNMATVIEAKNISVTNCYFENIQQTSTTPAGVENYIWTNNRTKTLYGAHKFASRIDGAGGLIISGNTIADAKSSGFEIVDYSRVTISDNVITNDGSTGYSIWFYRNDLATTPGYDYSDISISNNKISGGGSGIRIQGSNVSGNVVITGIKVIANIISNVNDDGIIFTYGPFHDAVIRDNSVNGYGGVGIYIWSLAESVANTYSSESILIKGNTISGDTSASSYGIYIRPYGGDTRLYRNIRVIANTLSLSQSRCLFYKIQDGLIQDNSIDCVGYNEVSLCSNVNIVRNNLIGDNGFNCYSNTGGIRCVENILNNTSNGLRFAGNSVICHDINNIILSGSIIRNEAVYFSGSSAGTPESVITASVGSTYTRTDGGSGTTFYVKESGTGNTGWVGK